MSPSHSVLCDARRLCWWIILLVSRLRLGCPRNEKKKFLFEPKHTETKSVSHLFRFVSWKQKKNFSVCFGVSNLYRNNRNKQNCFETNQNRIFWKIPKYALYQNLAEHKNFSLKEDKDKKKKSRKTLFIIQGGSDISVFRTYIETTETNSCFETNRNNPEFSEKYLNMLSIKI